MLVYTSRMIQSQKQTVLKLHMALVVYEGIDEQPGQQTKCYFQVCSTAELIGPFWVLMNWIKHTIEKKDGLLY